MRGASLAAVTVAGLDLVLLASLSRRNVVLVPGGRPMVVLVPGWCGVRLGGLRRLERLGRLGGLGRFERLGRLGGLGRFERLGRLGRLGGLGRLGCLAFHLVLLVSERKPVLRR